MTYWRVGSSTKPFARLPLHYLKLSIWSDKDNPHHQECADSVSAIIDQGNEIRTCAQVLIEYWVASTRPRDVNGFGPDIIEAADRLSVILTSFPCLVWVNDRLSQHSTINHQPTISTQELLFQRRTPTIATPEPRSAKWR